ncbi:MAG: 1-deoxy-D-xylulose-5-phosphate synthase [Nitrospinaceae bacterium]|nr:1-deoxy-D-xylulose-5-phosphate synthase [Nitrospinaceae bacterium]NIR56169.1 1-deoxy-D-xylulose-5-phosphate synthase [Nitrospinaceae bacterium]NIS86625.1 1-deoxy-D-xylulose-5-phosphate synthase [Nitrospinaceae bacterium]NIT83458.1 1-deoxy-D-xylulose-5-phosphate synthase [Nitrospinaceae bacterium]NIU45663.1 1-deoxy-D-xylulose-5-phosphate synthase [Nitrospinaceae bacterium]
MNKLLNQINCPEDLKKKIKREELPELAQEIRDALLHGISKTGGHLASNLGVVELTLALHYVFESPRDKFVWDVGHQSYVHKLLTGRREQFGSLRQYKGLSGFTRREENPHDHWNCGHGGTSISAAIAFAKARDLKNEDNAVVAIIGDGSLTAGMAFEGLNHTGHLKSDMIVVLNDNEMSISENVGGMSAHLSKIMTGQVMTKIRREIDELLLGIPGIGKDISRYAHKLDEAIKGVFIPGRLFEDLGFRYIGPVDGHDVEGLIETFRSVRKLKGPTLMHVMTRKGKGYEVAEEKAEVWHGASPFDVATGEFIKKKSNPNYTSVFAEALIDLAKTDEKIIGITAAMPTGTGINKFGKVFPERTFDVGMAEQHAVSFAGALSLEGFRPVAAIYSTFLQRAYDQVVHDVCLMNLPVTFAMDRAGIVGEDGATHQGLYDIAYLRTLPNMVVMAPKDENELRHMLKTAIYHPGPAALRYPRGAGLGVPLDSTLESLEIGKGEVLKDGTDIAILAYGHMVPPSLETAEMLEKDGLSVAVINARFAKPVDKDLFAQYAQSARCLVTIEEHSLKGGFGSAVLEALNEENLSHVQVKCIGVGDLVVEHGKPPLVRRDLRLDPPGLYQTISAYYNSLGDAEVSGNGKQEVQKGVKKSYIGRVQESSIEIKQSVNG